MRILIQCLYLRYYCIKLTSFYQVAQQDIYILTSMRSNRQYLFIYMANFMPIALFFSSLGSLIPFLAEDQGIPETEYSIIFVTSSVATIAAAVIYKWMEACKSLPNLHGMCILCAVLMGVSSGMIYFMKTLLWQCIVYALFDMFSYLLMITTNLCLLVAPAKEDVGPWMSYSHGVFGIAALSGPILVRFFHQSIFIFIAGICFALVPFLWLIPSPDNRKNQENQQKTALQTTNQRQGSLRLQVLLSLGFFLCVGIETTIQSWIPSYAVLKGIKNKQDAVQFIAIFWALNSIFRFVFGSLRGKDSFKFKSLLTCQLLSGVLSSLLAFMDYPQSAAYFCSIFYGITNSQLFPLLLSLPSEYNVHFSGSQISNMMLSTTISAGVFSSLTGVLMRWELNLFFYSLLSFSVLFFVLALKTIGKLRAEGGEEEQQKGMELRPIQK